MLRRLLLLTLTSLSLTCMGGAMAAGITYPEAPGPNPDHLITPPQENSYFNMRPDCQAFRLQIDFCDNYTDFLNRHYYDPHWDGMQWCPWDVVSTIEKQSRSMACWTEYNNQNVYGVCNGWARFWEVYSGYGPGPAWGSLK